jgi:hypothetical protein
MKKEEQLHQLIRALTPAEKKHVRINLSKFRPNEGSKKLLLFDSLNSQKKYSPGQTKNEYEENGYISNFLAADRHQLYDIILEELSGFHSKNSLEVQLSDGCQKVALLFEKKLFQQALKQIDRTEKLAIKAESCGTLINIYNYKRRILKITNNLKEAIVALNKQKKIWKVQERLNQFVEIHYKSILLRIKISKVRSPANLRELDRFMQHPLLEQLSDEDGYRVRFQYWETYCNYYFIKDDKHKELECNQALVDLIDNYPHFKKNEPLNHLVFRTRMFAINRNLHPENFWKYLAEYRALNQGFNKQRLQAESIIFIFSYNYEMDFFINNKKWKDGLKVLPEMKNGFKKYSDYIRSPLKVTSYYRVAYICFFNKKYREALDSLKSIIEDFSPELRPDVYSFALILKIIIHFEMGNLRLMPYLIKTAQYHISKRNLMFETEKVAIHYLKKLSKIKNKNNHETIFSDFYNEIFILTNDNEFERRSLEIFDFLTWLKSDVFSKNA